MATPRFTLPDPDRDPMTPLPAELWARILRCAQEGQTPFHQLKTRLNFEKVCKAWFMCDFRWRIVSILNLGPLESLLDSFVVIGQAEGAGVVTRRGGAGVGAMVSKLAGQVKTLDLRMKKTDAEANSATIVRLLRLMVNVECVELDFYCGRLCASLECLDKQITAALAALKKVKHFSLKGPTFPCVATSVRCTTDLTTKLTPKWSALESLAIKDCIALGFPKQDGTLTPSSKFGSVALTNCGMRLSRFDAVLASLPPTTREVKVDDSKGFGTEKLAGPLTPEAERIARQLERLTLDAGSEHGVGHFGPVVRGLLDALLPSLENVTHLTLHTSTISNIADLAKLKKLKHVTLTSYYNQTDQDAAASELVALIDRSTSLEQLELWKEVACGWSREGMKEVEEASRAKGIKFKWTARYNVEFDSFELWYFGPCPNCTEVSHYDGESCTYCGYGEDEYPGWYEEDDEF